MILFSGRESSDDIDIDPSLPRLKRLSIPNGSVMEDKPHSFMIKCQLMKAMMHNTYNWQKDEKQQIRGKNNFRLMELPAPMASLKSD